MTNPTRDRETPDDFAAELTRYGMPEKQAEVYAHRQAFNNPNNDVADQLNKDESTITNQHENAIQHASNAYAITHLTRHPKYLTQLPQQIGELTYAETDSPVHIRLHRPRKTADSKDYQYTLTYSEVIEIYNVNLPTTTNEDTYLAVYNYYKEFKNKGERTYFTLNEQFLTRFILDWVIPNRHNELRKGSNERYANKWFLTDIFDLQSVKKQFEEYNTQPIDVLTDTQFEPPTGEHVQLTSGARTGNTGFGYRPAYTPTEQEIKTAKQNGDISANTAEKLKTEFLP